MRTGKGSGAGGVKPAASATLDARLSGHTRAANNSTVFSRGERGDFTAGVSPGRDSRAIYDVTQMAWRGGGGGG